MGELSLDAVRELAAACAEREAGDPEGYPKESIASLKTAMLHGAGLPKAQRGLGWSLRQCTEAVEALARGSGSVALLASMPMGLAGIYGSDIEAPAEHRTRWLEQVDDLAGRYRAGEWYAACNSERGAGGSLAATKTVVASDGRGLFRISGEKILASSGQYADHFFSTAKVAPEELPGCGIVEFFFVRPDAPGVAILGDWDGFGMRPTESHTVRYESAPVESLMGFPDFLERVQPLQYWFCLFAAIPLGCAGAILDALAAPVPASPVLRLRFSEARMRYEALRAYLLETAALWRPAAGPAFAARVLRTKTYVTQEATKLSAELFALSGGRHYSRRSAVARALADSFAGTALRPPLSLALDQMVENFGGD
ncbi:MAG: acyl-CoA dehydrogenase family protein [Tepidiformaceae bacterium]